MSKLTGVIFGLLVCIFVVQAYRCIPEDCTNLQCTPPKCRDDQRIYKHLCKCCETCEDTLADGEKCQVTPLHYMGQKDCRPGSKCVGDCKPSDEYNCKGVCVKEDQ